MSLVGSATGAITGLLFTAFIPNCGEDCSNEIVGTFVICCFIGLATFSIFSIYLTKRSTPSIRLFARACAIISALFLIPAATFYIYKLHSEYIKFKSIAPVQPTTDFFHMAIAIRTIQGFTDASSGHARPFLKISQWERCLIGSVHCETSPRQAEILCNAGVMYVNEADWPDFKLIPQENSPGVAPLKSMQLCNGQ
jgi:hypothetical protein